MYMYDVHMCGICGDGILFYTCVMYIHTCGIYGGGFPVCTCVM